MCSWTASANCHNGSHAGIGVSVSQVGTTVTIEFTPGLAPDADTCTVTLDVGAEVCFKVVRGDTSQDGVTSTADASIIKPKFGGDPAVEGAEFDFNVDGVISTARAKPRWICVYRR